jgi:sugar O-acyltransferase (sialic acid O-acetyltransferase NeuD family)
MKKYCIYGAGGFGKDVLFLIKDIHDFSLEEIEENVVFMVDSQYFKNEKIFNCKCITTFEFDPDYYLVIVSIADPNLRFKMVASLPLNTIFTTLIHPSVIKTEFIEIGEGSIITAGCILSYNIKLGKHSHLNLKTTVGHDCIIGDYFTTSPSVNISGNCTIGKEVFIGVGTSLRENIKICDNVTIGMGSIVLNNILEEGTYFGLPAKRAKSVKNE